MYFLERTYSPKFNIHASIIIERKLVRKGSKFFTRESLVLHPFIEKWQMAWTIVILTLLSNSWNL